MGRCFAAVLLLGVSVLGAFAQQPGKDKLRSPSQQPPQDRSARERSEEARIKASTLTPQDRPLPPATARMVLVRYVIAQVALRGGEPDAAGKAAAESRPSTDAGPAKSPILAMPEESLFDAERLNKELQAAPMDLRGPAQKIGTRLTSMMKDRVVEIIQHGQLTTLDEQRAYVLLGQYEPRTTGVSINSFGRTYTQTIMNVGMQAFFTPRIQDNGRISLQIDMTKSQMGPVEEGAVLAELKDGEKVRTPAVEMMAVQTTITAAPGQAVALAATNTRRDSRRAELLILVSADLLDRD